MEKSESNKKEHQSAYNKTQSVIECESLCKEILKCVHKPVAPVKVKKERELLEGVTEYFIFWN